MSKPQAPFPTPLVSTGWLAAHLADPDLVILDASVEKSGRVWRTGRDAFAQDGHIPGAGFADLIHAFSNCHAAHDFTAPDSEQFSAAASALGISPQSRIVIYDRAEGIWAARLWWLFRSFGHEAVAVLDGGFTRWQLDDLPSAVGGEPEREGDFIAHSRPGFFSDKQQVMSVVAGKAPGHLVCVLRRPVFAGREQNYARPGHIPGSLNIPFKEQIDPRDFRLSPAAALAQDFAPLFADDVPVILYCGGGITAAGSALALTMLGRKHVSIYDGSLSEWAADPAFPMSIL